MNISVHLVVIAVAACLCFAGGAPEGARMVRAKQQRPTRGFKNLEMMTARGFGKRDESTIKTKHYGIDNIWEMLESSPETEGQEADEKLLESIPLEWFAEEMLNNPELARSVVRKFIDLNQDNILSPDELLRNV